MLKEETVRLYRQYTLLDGFIVKFDSYGVLCASDGFWKGADADRDKFKLSLHMSTYIFKIEILKKKKKINSSRVTWFLADSSNVVH